MYLLPKSTVFLFLFFYHIPGTTRIVHFAHIENFILSNTVGPPVNYHPKCQALVVAYGTLDHTEGIGSKVCLISIR